MKWAPRVWLACICLIALGYETTPAAGHAWVAETTVVAVTAGQPDEFEFTLSKSSLLPSTVTFKVTNKGSVWHRFKVCATPVTSAKLTSCNGTATRFLDPGQSGTFTVSFKKNGKYEFLSDVPGQAAKGMRGLVGIGVKLATGVKVTPTPATTTPTATTPTSTTPAPGSGDTGTGAALFVSLGCGTCHSLSAVKAAGAVTPSINTTHSGGGFPQGPLTAAQISALAAYVNG
jgi:uncharacterized cupredoxin-like copper-binding protein